MHLKADRISFQFPGQQPLFSDLSFERSSGTVTAVTGPSGCGKSTLLALVAGSLRPTTGTVDRVQIDTIGWVFQNPFGARARTALDHVVFPLLCKGFQRHAAELAALDVMRRFGIDTIASRRFRELSGGEAQRLMLARAVASSPDLLLVDEPTAQLDVHSAALVSSTLGAISSEGTIVLIATHDPRTRDACDSVVDLSVLP